MNSSPEVTISLLVYGPSPWLPDVIDALLANTAIPYELIVIDNGTTDDTRAYLATLEKARLVQPGRNLGFGVGHSYAANLARGRYFVTLNSDALVPPGWLEALIAPLAADPAVGAAMPVYVYPDGRLQEAGAAVEPSGQVIAFGRFDDVERVEHRVSGPVPFASAACMVTRTSTFRALGGFDARYGVAYYEDVDFAFALLARGLRVELVADVRVVHAQGASSTTASDAERMLLGNRERFRARYAPLLAGRPYVYARPEAHHLAAARDFDRCDRVLVVLDHFGAPGALTPGTQLVETLLARLRDGRVTVAAGGWPAVVARDAWLARGVEVTAQVDLGSLGPARRFHYAAVVAVPPAPADLAAIVRDTQPQATMTEPPPRDTLDRPDAFDAWLGSIGLVARLAPPAEMGAPL
ncbi:MAG: glycosyl transferase family 2 [Actinomycetia bacterium]|nr:glycosyl transferase family 2 [Actinomycetes bacterium]